jgi:hypothetical protein
MVNKNYILRYALAGEGYAGATCLLRCASQPPSGRFGEMVLI